MALDPSVVAAHRFGLGARPGELAEVAADPRAWLVAQCVPEKKLPKPLADLPGTGDDVWAFFGWLIDVGRKTRRAKRRGDTLPAEETDIAAAFRARHEAALGARLQVAAETDAPFRERLVHFWTNHFVVSAARPVSVAMPPSFERDVVRPHVMGRFEDMLLASSKHPAMLLYLDNHGSVGPNSKQGRNPKKGLLPIDPPTGLNENLAREILELHTLGVDGGYDQGDVTRFARVLTGWRAKVRPFFRSFYDGDDLMHFEADAHEPGTHQVLGVAYPQPGIEQGEAVLHDLARHPSTARFVATKLARHFIADDPPPAAVEDLAAVFLETEGDLAAVSRALVARSEAWSAPSTKLRTPQALWIAGLRGVPEAGLDPADALRTLTELGQPAYAPPSPAGYPDVASEWSGSDAIWKRAAWAQDRAIRARDAFPDPAAAVARMRALLGDALDPITASQMSTAPSASLALAIGLASPEFQRS